MGLSLSVSVGVELADVVGVDDGVAVDDGVGVDDVAGVDVDVGDVRDGPVTGMVTATVGVGLTHAAVVGVAGRADETAAAI